MIRFSFLTFSLLLSILLKAPEMKAQQQLNMSLKQCIDYGLRNHQSVSLYQNKVAYADQQAREALSAYLPQVNVSAGLDDNLKLQQTIIPEGTFGPGTPEQRVAFGTQYNSSMMVQLDQKLYDQSLITGLKANKPNIELSALNQQANNENLIFNIASAYYQIIVAQKNLDLLQHNEERLKKVLSVTQLQADQGVAKKIDVKQVQVNLNNVQSQIATLQNNLDLAFNTLKFNMGLPTDQGLQLTDTARWLQEAPSAKLYKEFDYDLTLAAQQQKVQMELLDINRKMIRHQAVPSLGIYGRYGANGFGAENLGDAFDPLLDYSAIGIKLTWSPFTGFRRDAQYKMAVIDLKNARENYELNRRSQALNFQNASSKVAQTQSTVKTNKSNVELASEVYENTTLQYRHGIATLTDLLNAELSFREAQNNFIASLLDYYLADLNARLANGSIQQFYQQL